jgi:hypothetical protein
MSSLVRSVLGAALLLTGAFAVMAASGTPVAAQTAQAGATTAVAATSNAPVANQTVQTGASTAAAAPNNAAQPQKPRKPALADNSDPYGGNDPNSTAGARAFFTPQY